MHSEVIVDYLLEFEQIRTLVSDSRLNLCYLTKIGAKVKILRRLSKIPPIELWNGYDKQDSSIDLDLVPRLKVYEISDLMTHFYTRIKKDTILKICIDDSKEDIKEALWSRKIKTGDQNGSIITDFEFDVQTKSLVVLTSNGVLHVIKDDGKSTRTRLSCFSKEQFFLAISFNFENKKLVVTSECLNRSSIFLGKICIDLLGYEKLDEIKFIRQVKLESKKPKTGQNQSKGSKSGNNRESSFGYLEKGGQGSRFPDINKRGSLKGRKNQSSQNITLRSSIQFIDFSASLFGPERSGGKGKGGAALGGFPVLVAFMDSQELKRDSCYLISFVCESGKLKKFFSKIRVEGFSSFEDVRFSSSSCTDQVNSVCLASSGKALTLHPVILQDSPQN